MSVTNLNYVDDSWIESQAGETFTTYNPARPSEEIGTYPKSDRKDTAAAIEAAVKAAPEWATMPGPERGSILRKTGQILEDRKQELIELLTAEEGKTHAEAAGEVQRTIDIFYYYAEKPRDFLGTVKASSGRRTNLSTRKQPVGTVGLITPWNYPIAIPAWKIAPALATGNTLVHNPASNAPGVSIAIFEALDEAGLPGGVANVVTGPGSAVGDEIITHPDIDAISFTGSSAVGERVYKEAAADGKRVQTELGGKNPTIVTDSADLEKAASIVANGGFGVTGQACTACSRAIVLADVYDEFVESLIAEAESIEVGPGEEYDMGPQITESERESTLKYIETAKEEGNTLEFGGDRLEGGRYGEGHFVQPTVFSGVDPNDTIAQEEIFGPVIAVIEADDFESALEIANGVEYGLSASIVTENHTEAEEFVRDIQSGVAKVNDKTTGLELHVPFGGFGRSSSETWREQGDEGLEFYTIEKTIYDNF